MNEAVIRIGVPGLGSVFCGPCTGMLERLAHDRALEGSSPVFAPAAARPAEHVSTTRARR